MYGMIHKAARGYAIDRWGTAFWEGFLADQGLSDPDFIAGENYPDESTFAVIGQLSAAGQQTVEGFLHAFGRYWIRFASEGEYAHLMSIGGKDLPTFIRNLNRMHEGLAGAMPGSRMPSFDLIAQTPEGLTVSYRSSREGLEPFVVGLLEGLCSMFAVDAEVVRRSGPGVVFDIRYLERAAT